MSVRLSICPSLRHKPVLCAKGYTHPQSFFSPWGIPTIVVFPFQTGWQYSDEDPSNGAPNARNMKKSRLATNIGLYRGTDARKSNNSKTVQDRAIFIIADQQIWSIERRNFQWPWTTPTHGFYFTPFWLWNMRNGTIYIHSFNGILIGTYTRPIQQCHFELAWVTLNGLAKYSMTRSIVRSLCDSWATCGVNGEQGTDR